MIKKTCTENKSDFFNWTLCIYWHVEKRAALLWLHFPCYYRQINWTFFSNTLKYTGCFILNYCPDIFFWTLYTTFNVSKRRAKKRNKIDALESFLNWHFRKYIIGRTKQDFLFYTVPFLEILKILVITLCNISATVCIKFYKFWSFFNQIFSKCDAPPGVLNIN